MKLYCEHCKKETEFTQVYNKKRGHPYSCMVCWNEYVPQNRDHRRGDNVKKHTWEVDHKRK